MTRFKNNSVISLALYLIVLFIQLCCSAHFRGGPGNRFGHRPFMGHQEWRGPVQSYPAHPTHSYNSQDPVGCNLPSFEDSSEVKFSLEQCQHHGSDNYPVCAGFGTVPHDWVGIMTCKNELLTVRFSSTCIQRGLWSPAFPSGCYQLLRESHGAIKETSPAGIVQTNGGDDGVTEYPHAFNTASFRPQRPREGPCAKLRVNADTRFVYSCVFPGATKETENCGSESTVDSGTMAILDCRSPWASATGKPNVWTCENGRWQGPTNQIQCYRSSTTIAPPSNFHQTYAPNYSQAPERTSEWQAPSFSVPSTPRPSQYQNPYEQLPTPPTYTTSGPAPYFQANARPGTISSPAPTFSSKPATTPLPVYTAPPPPPPEYAASPSPVPIKPPVSRPVQVVQQPVTSPPKATTASPENLQFWDFPEIDIREGAPQDKYQVYTFKNKPNQTPPTTELPSTLKTTKWPTTVAPQLTTTSVEDKETSAAQCPALRRKKPGLKVECTFRYKYVSVSNCEDPVPPGSEAKYSCEEHYETTSGLPSHFRKCKPDGTWTGTSDQFSCIVQCGTSTTPRVPYITFGTPSLRGQWPWHAALFIKTEIRDDKWSYACGGTLIGKRAVLTAAHCVTHLESTTLRSRTSMRVDLGKYYREEIDEFVQVRDIDDIVVHPSYSPYGYDSDLAVIILKKAVKVGFHVRPACFPQTADSRVEELHLSEKSIGTVVGWGYTENKKLADVLQITNLPVASSRECLEEMQAASAFQLLTRSTTFCAGFKNNTNVCGGDSGGGMFFPFKQSDSTRWYLEGVVSVGIPDKEGNCDPTKYSTFTRVGRYADWIVRQLTEHDAV